MTDSEIVKSNFSHYQQKMVQSLVDGGCELDEAKEIVRKFVKDTIDAYLGYSFRQGRS